MRWGRGKVTEVLSQNKVAVDGVPRHVLDTWRVSLPSDEEVAEIPQEERTQRLQRERRRPAWIAEYETNF